MVPFLISYHIYPGPATCPYCKQPHAGESERLTYYSLAGFSVSSQENLDPPLVEDSRQKEACCFSVERGLDPPIQTIDQ